MRRQFGRPAPRQNVALDTVSGASVPRFAVLFELDESDHSKAYEPTSGETAAQFEVRKTLILRDNPGFGRPRFEPGGRRFESVRARQ